MKILIMTPILPFPLMSGGQVRIYNLIKNLSRRNAVSLLSFVHPGSEHDVAAMRDICNRVEVVTVQKKRAFREKLKDILDFRETRRHLGRIRLLARGAPLGAANLYNPAMAESCRKMMREDSYDVLEINFCQMAQYMPRPRGPKPISALVDIDLAIVTMRRIAETSVGWARRIASAEHRRLKQWCSGIMPSFHYIITASHVDAERLRKLNPHIRTMVVSNGVDTEYFQFSEGTKRQGNVVYLGGTAHTPNVTALNDFARHVFPHIKERCPQVKLKVIGDVDVGLLPFLDDDPSVEFAGFVGDLRKEFGSAGLMVVPLRVGGGTRLKILEAMAVGVPVLSTSVGCEGIEASPGEHIAVADDWHEFADTAVNLLLDDQKRSTMAKKARGFVEAHYSWHQIAEDYERHLSRVLHFRG